MTLKLSYTAINIKPVSIPVYGNELIENPLNERASL